MESKYDIAILGAGPGGYVAAIRAAQLGSRVALVEREHIGGICLNWGCIPTKALLDSAHLYEQVCRAEEFGLTAPDPGFDIGQIVRRSRDISSRLVKGIRFLLKKSNIDIISASGKLAGDGRIDLEQLDGDGKSSIMARDIIIATGGHSRTLPGVAFRDPHIWDSHQAMIPESLPSRLAVIGAGAIGIEFADFYATMGTEVTIVEMLPHLLPLEDEQISIELERLFRKRKIRFLTSAAVREIETGGNGVILKVEHRESTQEIIADKCLIAIGVQANSDSIGLKTVGVTIDRGFIPVDGAMRTNIEHIYAIGDVTGPPLLAHVASAQGIRAVEAIHGQRVAAVENNHIPACTYCRPQVASVGMTEAEAQKRGTEVRIGRFPLRANGRALAAGSIDGFIKVIVDTGSDTLIGAHMIGDSVSELIVYFATAIREKTPYSALKNTIFPHPTISESGMEALADAFGEAIHLPKK